MQAYVIILLYLLKTVRYNKQTSNVIIFFFIFFYLDAHVYSSYISRRSMGLAANTRKRDQAENEVRRGCTMGRDERLYWLRRGRQQCTLFPSIVVGRRRGSPQGGPAKKKRARARAYPSAGQWIFVASGFEKKNKNKIIFVSHANSRHITIILF